jgi:hypothetical protein
MNQLEELRRFAAPHRENADKAYAEQADLALRYKQPLPRQQQ